MNTLQIHLFGNPQLIHNNEPLTGFVSSKAVALVYYLAATNRPQGRDTLAALFWADAPEARAKKNLRDVLSNLRRLFGPFLDVTRQAVTLQTETTLETIQCTVDTVELDVALSNIRGEPATSPNRTAQLEQALAQLQGEFLEGFYVQDAPVFEEWVLGERERYSQLTLQILSDLVADCAQRGTYLDGINYATQSLTLDPLEEETHRQLMTMYAATGQYAAALAQYERCCEILYEELGTEPSPETSELFERVQAVHERPAHQLPTEEEQTPFVGRTYELAEIQRLLANADCRLLTLAGLGGIGKTRLAYQVARLSARHFLDGVYFIPLESAEAADQLVATIADAIGLSLSAGEDPQEQLLNFLRRKELLLVLDNSEILVAAEQAAVSSRAHPPATGPLTLLTAITRAAPGVKLLVTSRERLNLRVEQLFEVTGLAVPEVEPPLAENAHAMKDSVQEIIKHDAVQLFLQCARRVWVNATPDDAEIDPNDLQVIVQICQLVGGMPLAIELAAGWVHTLSYHEILQEIEQGIDLLETTMHDVPDRHRSLRAVFDHSWQLLSPNEQTIFMKLSVFRGGFIRAAAQKIAGATLPVLMNLVRYSFLRRSGTEHYSIHSLLRQYAEEQFQQQAGELAETQARHGRFYARFLQQHQAALETEQVAVIVEQIATEMENIRVAYAWAIGRHDVESITQMTDGLYHLYLLRNWFLEGIERFRNGAIALEKFTHAATGNAMAVQLLQGKLAARWGMFCRHLGQYETAREQLTNGLTKARQSGDNSEIAFCLLGLAKVALGQSAYIDAEQVAQESLDIYQQVSDQIGSARALQCLGETRLLTGNSETARQDLVQALAVAQARQLRWTEAECVATLGEVCWNQGDYPGAHRYFERAANLFRSPQITNLLGVAEAFNKLGFVAWSQGNFAEASAFHQQAYQSFHQLGNYQGEGNTLSHLGRVAERQQKYDEALQLYRQALTMNQEIGDRHGEAISLCNLGFVAYHQGDYATAMTEFTDCRETCRQIGFRRYEAMALACLGLLYSLRGDYKQSDMIIRNSLQIAEELQDPTILGYGWAHLGHLLVEREEWAEATTSYQNALGLRRAAGDEGRMLDALSGLAYIAWRQDRMDEAERHGAELLTYLDDSALASALLPLQIHYICYVVLLAEEAPRATEHLNKAHELLQKQALFVTNDADRNRLFTQTVLHQEILYAFQTENSS